MPRYYWGCSRVINALDDIHAIIEPPEGHEFHGLNRTVIRGGFVGSEQALAIQETKKAGNGCDEIDYVAESMQLPGTTKKGRRYRRVGELFPDVPRAWVVFDIDGARTLDDKPFNLDKPGPQIRAYLIELGGELFQEPDFLWRLSNSVGTAGKDPHEIRAHVWMMCDTPVSSAQWRRWGQARKADMGNDRFKLDLALFNPVQLVFIMPPKFRGVEDPMQGRARSGIEWDPRWGGALRTSAMIFPEAPPVAEKKAVQRTRAPESDRADPHHHRDPVHAAFCRAFDVERAFELIPEERFTVDRSRPDGGLRVTWGQRASEGGCWIDNDGLRISGTYDSWPTTDSSLPQKFDAWEFVAHFKFNEAPNAPAPLMTAFARGLPEVEAELEQAQADEGNNVVIWSDTPAENGAEMVDALASRGVLYAQGQAIVEITGGLINEVKVPRLRALLAIHGIQLARFMEGGATQRPSATEEKDAAQVGLARFDLPSLNPLHRVVTRPIFQPADGRLLGHGYHKEAKTFVALAAPWDALSIPDKPTHEQLTEAVRFLKEEALEGFEFDTVDDQAAAIALLVTAGCRSGFKTAPAFAVLSEMPGSGKTTLTTMAQIVAGEPKTIPFPKRAEEVAKVILSELMSGAPTINFDNVGTGWHINDPSLNRLIGAEVYSDRELGGNKTPSFANDRLLMLNGNKL